MTVAREDIFLAIWVVLAGAAFILMPLMAILCQSGSSAIAELILIGRYVYLIVLSICLIAAAVRAVRRITKPDKV